MAPHKGGVMLKILRLLLYGAAYALSFILVSISSIGGRGHPHQLIGGPTIGVSTAHADTPPPPDPYVEPGSSCNSCDSCGCSTSDGSCAGGCAGSGTASGTDGGCDGGCDGG